MATIPVLMYHHVNPNSGDMITVTPEDFESHLKSIKEGGYRTLSLNELYGFIEGSFKCEERAVVLTFDDGYLDNFVYAFPLLKKYGLHAVIFTVAGWIDGASSAPINKEGLEAFKEKTPNHRQAKALVARGSYSDVIMNWDMARAMQESGLVEFASHTLSHIECDSLPERILKRELTESKKRLLRELKTPCEYLCWPRGRFNESSIRMARDLGYKGCFTTERGIVSEGLNPMSINRIAVKAAPNWVGKRLAIYTSPLLARLYLGIKGKTR
ncbi:MAG: polysaccharide deacetylase family protein [Thermodesulfobacteriota bacterium]